MSFRHPFVTDFIYQASDETRDANDKIKSILEGYTKHGKLESVVDKAGYGYFSGVLWSTAVCASMNEEAEEMIYRVSEVTKVPFRLTIMYESGPVVTYSIEPKL